jgi:uncharacterized membrane protein
LDELQREVNNLVLGASPVARPGSTGEAESIESEGPQELREKPSALEDQQPSQTPVLEPTAPARESALDKWLAKFRELWMVWLGGLCVALAGIFLVRYSIEQGILGPTGRIVLAMFTGCGLHIAAEWFRRRSGMAHPAFAALAGGASIMLYAAVLAALQLYQLLEPGPAFVLLAAVALATMALALLHGPLLAVIGILGAYIVPILVFDDSSAILVVLLYSIIITAAAQLLMRSVYRPWLWYGALAGGLGWWIISLTGIEAEGVRGWYLAALSYLILAVPDLDWRLSGSQKTPSNTVNYSAPIFVALVLIIVAQAFSISLESFSSNAVYHWSPLIVLLLWACRKRDDLAILPWVSLISQWLAWLYCGLSYAGSHYELATLALVTQQDFVGYALLMTLLYSGMGWMINRGTPYSHARASLIIMAPVSWLALAYLLVTDLSQVWDWSLLSVAMGLAYIHLAQSQLRQPQPSASAQWLILAGHLAYSLAVVMLLREATLTLALAGQLVSLAWLIRRFKLDSIDWLVKVILAVVLTRLTFNPWMLTYPADVHWSLWTYGGAMLCCFGASRLLPVSAALKPWLEAVALQLLVLFAAAETRYWLYDGEIFVRDYTLLEAAINTSLWGLLGLVYHYRGQLSESLGWLYTTISTCLLTMTALNYLLVLLVLNPIWGVQEIGSTAIFNLLLLAFGAPPLLALLAHARLDGKKARIAGIFAAVGSFVFVSMEIRHLWQGTVNIHRPTPEGELYTYSAVWMLLAAAAILLAGRLARPALYRGGMGLLLLVIAKLFFVDMSDLEGLWRVASFMGLGLSLLGLGYLHRRIG